MIIPREEIDKKYQSSGWRHWKFYSNNKFFKYKLNIIRHKRNKLVHENISEITQEDRNFVKHISDLLIYFLMEFDDKIKSFSDYGLILDNYGENNISHKINLMEYACELKRWFEQLTDINIMNLLKLYSVSYFII